MRNLCKYTNTFEKYIKIRILKFYDWSNFFQKNWRIGKDLPE